MSERKQIVGLIWMYFVLIFLEGSLRKWGIPALSNPLLVVRDPIALGAIILTVFSRYQTLNIYTFLLAGATLIAFVASLSVGHQNFSVALFGSRIYLLHFPMIFIMGTVLVKEDIVSMGKFLLWFVLPVTVLLVMQFYSPQSAWVNRGIGGDLGGSGFSGALGYYRPATIFSFSTGTTSFYSLVTCFVSYFWISPQHKVQKWLLLSASFCILVAIPMSISRGYLFQSIITFGATILLVSSSGKTLVRALAAVPVLVIVGFLLSGLPFLQAPIEAFQTRFVLANKSEGGVSSVLGDRFLGNMFRSVTALDNNALWGEGIGIGSNFGAKMLTGSRDFLVGEGEWGRIIGEFGVILGLLVIFTRVSLLIHLALNSLLKVRQGNHLPILLLSFGSLLLLQGNTAQPTSLGFIVLIIGMTVASFNTGAAETTQPVD